MRFSTGPPGKLPSQRVLDLMLTLGRIVISFTLLIYMITGRKIFKKRAMLRSFSRKARSVRSSVRSSAHKPIPVITNPFMAGAPTIHVQNEISVHVSSNPLDSCDVEPTAEFPVSSNGSRSSFSSTRHLSTATEPPISVPQPVRYSRASWAGPPSEVVEEKIETAQCSYQATVSATNTTSDLEAGFRHSKSRTLSLPHIRRTATRDGNTAAWGYFKVAFLMFIALFVVWVPATINRVQQLTDQSPVFGLNLVSALCLPLQGFWNAMVYMATTWSECKRALAELLNWPLNNECRSATNTDRRDSQHTLTANDAQGSEVEIPLHEMLKQGPLPLSPRMSSVETMKTRQHSPPPK